MVRIVATFLVCLVLQIGFWIRTHEILPDMTVVPDVPGVDTVQALSFGDEEVFFRVLALQLQNAGDTFGRFTALYKYDYNKLYHWFRLLDRLDNTSNYIPSMATYYFSQTQNKPDVRYVVDYLMEHADGRVGEKWWWLVQGVYLANHKLEDKPLALEFAKKLIGAQDVPIWVRQLPAFIYEQNGDNEAALGIIKGVLDNSKDLNEGELNFMQYFVKDRLKKMGVLDDQFNVIRKEVQENPQPEKHTPPPIE